MARSCGIRVGTRRFEIVALEGSARNPKVVACLAGDIPDGTDPIAAAVEALREAVKGRRIPADNVGLAVDTGLAAFRPLTLPFSDRAKIEEVIKFEVESQLPQWSIDQVVVDFFVLSESQNEAQLLVAAVSKEELGARITICERAGLEALDADLEGTAMFNAAARSGILDAEQAQILVHIGEESTTVSVVDGGRLRSMRAVHIGAFVRQHAEPATGLEGAASAAGGQAAASGEKPAADAATATAESPVSPANVLMPTGAASRARLVRELVRTVIGTHTDKPLAAVYVCGHEVPGLLNELTVDVEVKLFDPFSTQDGEALACEISGDQERGRFAAAFGAALARLGDVALAGSLRREDLAFSGKLERLELPLAVAGLLLVATLTLLVATYAIRAKKADADLSSWFRASNNYALGVPDSGILGRLRHPSDKIKAFREQAEASDGVDLDGRTRFEQLEYSKQLVDNEINALKKDLGQISEVTMPQSALEAATLVLGKLEELGEKKDAGGRITDPGLIGRFSIRQFQADYQAGSSNRPESVDVRLDMTFFAANDVEATKHYNDMLDALRKAPWCIEIPDRRNEVLDSGAGIFVDSLIVKVDVSKAPES